MSHLLEAALAAWGFGGMLVILTYTTFGWGIAAQSVPVPGGDWACYIEADPEQMTERTILHEVGHCVGFFNVAPGVDHSSDPESVMYSLYRPGQVITAEDRMVVFRNTRWWMTEHVIVPGVSR